LDQEELSENDLMKGGNTRDPISKKKGKSSARDEDDPKEGGSNPKEEGSDEPKEN